MGTEIEAESLTAAESGTIVEPIREGRWVGGLARLVGYVSFAAVVGGTIILGWEIGWVLAGLFGDPE